MIDLTTIATKATIGPIRVGQTFSETLRLLGNPNHLNFPHEDMFDGILVYGPVEIFVRTSAENVTSYLVQLHLFKGTTRRHLRISKDISFERPEELELSYERIQRIMREADVQFRTNSAEEAVMHSMMEFNEKVRFYFLPFGRNGSLRLSYIELAHYQADT
ncbi:hypothetical protein [Sinorhizobium fredii]|uniref:hypothetical protein n=1 Tax=Rhizobium fredii TaxID=380 RepID=UPI0005697D3F|nr:hypothetical protein [Sinorhizobium fredii]